MKNILYRYYIIYICIYVSLLHINRRSSFIVPHSSRIALMMLPSPAPRVVPHLAARRNRGVVWRGPSAFAKPLRKTRS